MSTQRILSLVGIVGGLFWIALAFFPPECAPVTEASEDFCNRLWSPAPLGMGLGFVGLFLSRRSSLSTTATIGWIALLVSFALMFLGNVVEYWFLNHLPHQGPGGLWRGLAWMTVLLGFLLVHLASASVGALGLRSGHLPRWLGAHFLTLLPATVVVGLVGSRLQAAGIGLGTAFIGLPIGVISLAVGIFGWAQNSPAARHRQIASGKF